MLSEDELPKFMQAARDFDITVVQLPKDGQRPLRAVVRIPRNETRYMDFALTVRPHHQSDS